jgi:DNA repair protein RecN (Recombination protein N)
VESLKLLSGQRSQSDMVRTGDERLQVEAVFTVAAGGSVVRVLDELGVPGDDALVLRRDVSEGGRSRCWINDVTVTVGALQQVAPHLLAVHGQHEQHGLADAAVQRQLVDDFGGHDELRRETAARWQEWRRAADDLEQLRAAQASRHQRLEIISFQLQEIEAADPREDEDEELRRRRLVVRHAVRIAELSADLLDLLSDGERAVVDSLARSERDLEELGECGLETRESLHRLVEARLQVEDVVRELQSMTADQEADGDDLEAIESRLHLLEQLMLKYGPSLLEVRSHRERLVAERDELESVEERISQAEAAAATALKAYDDAASRLDHARREAAEELAASVEEVLARLAMAGTRLEFTWEPRSDAASPLLRGGRPVAFDADGVEECELLLAANPGEALRSMSRIASGGELSRIHLAIRTALRGRRRTEALTLLFDEVDSGLGGATAAALAELLADLASTDQVLVVTHLPQVAARAVGHFKVDKVVEDGRSVTRVHPLTAGGREEEIARMLAGDEVTDSALAHARVLLGAS